MNNPTLKIAVCNRRTDRKYKNVERTWAELKDRNRVPVRTTETVKEYPQLSKEQRDALKDQGGFVGGWLREGIRKNGYVISRCVGALDADNIPAGVAFPALVRKALAGVEWFLYSTHKHMPEAPRFRLVILFDREVLEDEYPALMRQVAHDIGMDFFDDTTYQANRMMYWASCPSDGKFVFEESLGGALHVDGYLARFDDWRDAAQWPFSSRQSEVMRTTLSSQEDPLNKEGLVGAFCRTYFPVQTAMETFLSDVYAPTGVENRWDYLPADSTAGVVIYDDRFVYSHHATDPAGGKLLNAFDLVRIHKFGNDETKKSFQQMCEFVLAQDAVKQRLDEERVQEAQADFGGYEGGDWTKQLRYKPKSKELENSTWNLMLIFANDPLLQGIAFNGLANQVQILGEVPWERDPSNLYWRQADDAQLMPHLYDDNLQADFVKVCQRLSVERDEVIGNLHELQQLIGGTDELEKQKAELEAELDSIGERLQALIDHNARVAMNQEVYKVRFDELSGQYQRADERVKEIEQTILKKELRQRQVKDVIQTIEGMPEIVTEFSPELWATLVKKETVYGKGDLRFTLASGAEVRV